MPTTPKRRPEFRVVQRRGRARAGVLTTEHGVIQTPAFVPVGTKATVKAVLPGGVATLGAQAVLANAYHLYLQPGPEVVEAGGGVGAFMGWRGPTFTDSGGFQVMSLGAGFKKVLAMAVDTPADDVIAPGRERLAHVDDDGVGFISHLDGSKHRFTPESSMLVQHQIGADIIFAFDECTTLMNTRGYQEGSVARTAAWARRCLRAHHELSARNADRAGQGLFAVIQGAQYEDLRRAAAADLANVTSDGAGFAGFGIGGALEKLRLEAIVGWVSDELPEDRPRHLLGIGEPDDLFAGVAAGADTFDCVMPSRVARNGAILAADGRYNVTTAANRRDFRPLEDGCDCHTCAHHTRAYLHHLNKSSEMLGHTLATIHNLRFLVRLVDQMREAIIAGDFDEFRANFLGRYYAQRPLRNGTGQQD